MSPGKNSHLVEQPEEGARLCLTLLCWQWVTENYYLNIAIQSLLQYWDPALCDVTKGTKTILTPSSGKRQHTSTGVYSTTASLLPHGRSHRVAVHAGSSAGG